jgi:hypothetical protein
VCGAAGCVEEGVWRGWVVWRRVCGAAGLCGGCVARLGCMEGVARVGCVEEGAWRGWLCGAHPT